MPKAKKIAVGAILGAVFLPLQAFASILFAQQQSSMPDTAVYCNYLNAYSPYGEIALTYAGPATEIGYISAIAHASTTQSIRLQIFQYTSPTFLTLVQSATVYATMLGTKGRVNWLLSDTGMWLNATSSYRIIIGGGADPNVAFYGTSLTRTDIYSYGGGVGGSWGSHCTSDFGMPWLEIGTDDASQFFDASAVTSPATFRACSFYEPSGCIANALSWAFYPSIPLSTQLGTLASSTNSVIPFGYIADIYGLYSTISGYATTSLVISVELSPIMNWLGGNFASTTIDVVNTGSMKTLLGSTWTLMQNILKAIFWTMFLSYIYHRTRKFL